MANETLTAQAGIVLLDAVALLAPLAERRLERGQVGTVVEWLDDATVLVEFSDDDGRAFALAPVAQAALLVLRTAAQAA